MNGRFINDVIEFKCQDGKRREAMIIKDFNDGRFDVAYIKSNGCRNVTVHVEENVNESRLLGESVHKETILPYHLGDLVAYYVEPETYYLAHIVEIGSYNTVKVLLGDLFMGEWIQDNKKGDVVESDVKNIRWDGPAKDVDKDTKIRYGYEPHELKEPHSAKKSEGRIGKFFVAGFLCGFMAFAIPKVYDYLENQPQKPAIEVVNPQPYIEKTQPAIEIEKPSSEVMESYKPIERIFVEIYKKPLEDITDEEKAAITYLKVSESKGITGDDCRYYIYYSINGGEEQRINFECALGIDSYNFPQFTGVTELSLKAEDLKTLDFISSMPQVSNLEIGNTSITDISALEDVAIETLTFNNNRELANYSSLAKIKGLKNLNISCDGKYLETVTEDLIELEILTTNEVSLVGKCPNLKTLNVSYYSTGSRSKDLSIIANNESIEELFIINGNVDESAQAFFSMPNLKTLSFDGCELRVSPNKILDNDRLTSLSFNNTSFIENYSEEGSGFVFYINYDTVELADHMDIFSHFSNLQNLSITNQKITDISVLSNLKELETLDLTGNFITDYTPLSALPKLKQVTIIDNPFNVDPSTIEIGDGVEVVYQ